MTRCNMATLFGNFSKVTSMYLLMMSVVSTLAMGLPFIPATQNMQKVYADDVFKDYPYDSASAISRLLDEYGPTSSIPANTLDTILANNKNSRYIYNDAESNDVSDDFESLYPERLEDNVDSVDRQLREDKLVGARAKRMNFILPIGYYRRFLRNYRVRHAFPGKIPAKRRLAFTALRGR